MLQEIQTISLALPYRLGRVNCYLLKTDAGHILIDTGCRKNRTELGRELESAGCKPDNLQLIVITHGDFDHTGNAAYISKQFGTKIAMHHDDSGMVERGNMFWNRKKSNVLTRMITPVLFRFGKTERFKPDLYLEDGDDLSEYGFEARILHIPGHSKGSIGILTANNDLFCGDLLESTSKPDLNSIMDNLVMANTSIKKINNISIKTVYPGHGKPFMMEVFLKRSANSQS